MPAPDELSQLRSIYWNPERTPQVTCEVCTAPVDGYSTCFACREHVQSNKLRADLVAPISYAVKGTQAYRDLVAYKSAPPAAASRDRLFNVLHQSLSAHIGCFAARSAAPFAVGIVPSTSGQRPGPHPLEAMIGMFGSSVVRAELQYVGPSGLDANARRILDPSRFRVVDEAAVAGRHVLLVDDSWVRGGHIQSSSGALKVAGAAFVSAVPIGRVLDRTFDTTAKFLAARPQQTFDFNICPLTGQPHT